MRLGVVMDPIGSINIKKDSTFAMLLAAQKRGWELFYMEMGDIALCDDQARGHMRPLRVMDNARGWYEFTDAPVASPLSQLDILLMRKDPPFDTEYVYATYILEQAELAGTLVVNRPEALRNASEKLLIARFPDLTPPTLVTRRKQDLREFWQHHDDIIVKPLGGMGGASIFRVTRDDPNASVIFETLTRQETQFAQAQRFLPEISAGDKRILLVDGEPVPYALARIPQRGETRGNLAAGGRGEGVPLSKRDREICERVAPFCRERGLWFVGLDVIGDYLTEINVTSPTCIRELDALYQLDIAGQLLNRLEAMRDA